MDHPLDCPFFHNGSADLTCFGASDDAPGAGGKSTKVSKKAKNVQAISDSSYNSPTSEGSVAVRSKAVVTYSASKSNAVYSRLPPQTDINDTPSNWLRKTIGLRPESLLFGSNYVGNRGNQFSGFTMAGCHLQHIGKIDVVSDAENIKKLLKMPYSDAHVSMVIHRIGRTLLFEKFDMKKYTTEESQWKGFRDFYEGFLQQEGNNSLKKKSASSQHDRIMNSKFLYHSVCGDSQKKLEKLPIEPIQTAGGENKDTDHGELDPNLYEMNGVDRLVPKVNAISIENERTREDNPPSPDRRWRYWSAKESSPESSRTLDEESFGFERNIFWTFEDLKMILGTNMPIFGGGKYPAVSLRLRDSQKPINVLTGIDYWLDNLICNVPELVMCFHVDGIVQNYEFIKTEDIPKLKDSGFSPQVIKDIAQNILSFLKSNCTKEGHTYWLFKGSDDDVVKLYDLSTLCQNGTQETQAGHQQNPYVISVAMLLYKTAINLMQSQDTIIAKCDHHATVRKLLLHCVELLHDTKYQHIACHAVCLLSDLCLSGSNLRRLHEASDADDQNGPEYTSKACDTCSAYLETEERTSGSQQESEENQEIATISSVSDLYHPEKFVPITAAGRIQESGDFHQTQNVEKSCLEVIQHAITGFNLLAKDCKKCSEGHLLQYLSRNAAKAYFGLAEEENKAGNAGNSLNRIQLAFKCYETYDFLVSKFGSQPSTLPRTSDPTESVLLLPKILSLCGEVQFQIVQEIRMHGDPKVSHYEGLQKFTESDDKILELLGIIFKSGGKYDKLVNIKSKQNEALEVCGFCYEIALNVLDEASAGIVEGCDIPPPAIEEDSFKSTKRKAENSSWSTQESETDTVSGLRSVIIRRHGHIQNERGALMLDVAVSELNITEVEDFYSDPVTKAWRRTAACFQSAYDRFCQVDDYLNQALVLSNLGRLMRVSAQFFIKNDGVLLSAKQRASFDSALSNYQKALELLDLKDVKQNSAIRETSANARDSISWDLSTCYLTMAQMLQDSGFESQSSREELEKEVVSWLNNSQKYSKTLWKNSAKSSAVKYRQVEIHHRLASLYHNSYRLCSESQKMKYLRNIAEKNYINAIEILDGPEYPNKKLRVQLERLAMKEYHINSVTSSTIKLKLLIEGLQLICLSTKALESMHELLFEETYDLRETADLLRIIVTILQSFLLAIVQLTAQSDSNSYRKSKNPLKDLYGRALKNLQPVLVRGEDISREKIEKDLLLVVDMLDEVPRLISD